MYVELWSVLYITIIFYLIVFLRVVFWVVPRRVVLNSRRFETLCRFHFHRRVDMKCVKVERYVVEGGTDRPSHPVDGTDTVFRNVGY
jgi:hypothetical protein